VSRLVNFLVGFLEFTIVCTPNYLTKTSMQKIMILYTYNQKYFSILKLRDSYSQIPEEKEDAEL